MQSIAILCQELYYMKEKFIDQILYASVGQAPSSYKHRYCIHMHAAIPQPHLLNTNLDMTRTTGGQGF